MSPSLATRRFEARHYDFSKGVVGGVADRSRIPKWLKLSDNLVGRPHGSIGSVRGGYREIQQSNFSDEPTSIGKLVPGLGASNRIVVHTKDAATPGAGKLFSIQPTINGRTQLTPPFSISDADCWERQLNGALFIAQQGGSNVPLMYHVDGGVHRLDATILRPPTGFSLSFAPSALSGGVDPGTHWWRLRYRYRNGASQSTAAFPAGGRLVTINTEKITVGNLLNDVAALAQQDWIGWTLERTTLATVTNGHYTGTIGGDALPDARAQWFWVADGTAATFDDIFRDADLFYRIDPGIYGNPPHMDGVVPYRNRLVGWAASTLFVSQAVGDEFGTGPCNFDAELAYTIGDDWDPIQCVVLQGDRLLVVKTRSFHPFEGLDPDDFRTYQLPFTGGTVGPRAVTVHGTDVISLGETGLLRVRGNQVDPWGEIEVGHYLADMNAADSIRAKVKAFTVAGEYISFAYPSANSPYNDEEIIFDLQVKEFRHFAGRRIRDALVQEDNSEDFDGATLLTLDPALTAPPSDLTDLDPTFLAWVDAGVPTQSRAQKIDSGGVTQWGADGVLIGTATVSTSDVAICPDASGGCIVAYSEDRGGALGTGVFVQRLNSAGVKQWGPTGLAINNDVGNQTDVEICADGVGGAYIAYLDFNLGPDRIVVHRIDLTGTLVPGWPVAFSTEGNFDVTPFRMFLDPITSDLMLAWWVHNGTNLTQVVQRLNGAGVAAWTAGGVTLGPPDAAGGFSLHPPPAISDGNGGIITFRAPTTVSLVAMRVDAAGAIAWTSTNIAAGLPAFYSATAAVPDGAGGILCFFVNGSGAAKTIHASRVNSAGALLWGPTEIQGAGSKGAIAVAVADGANGAILLWSHDASGTLDLYAQRITNAGTLIWGGGAPISVAAAAGTQERMAAATDAASGVIVYWDDNRATRRVFGQRILAAAGAGQWAVNGVAITTNLSTGLGTHGAVFTGTPVGDAPASGVSVYRIWAHPVGQRDEQLADGTGGRKIPVRSVTPMLDGGAPDIVKHITRLQLDAEGDDTEISATFTIDPGDGTGERLLSAPLVIQSEGTLVGDETPDIDPTDGQVANEDGSATGITGLDVVAGESTLRPFTGLGDGVFGTRYSLEVRADTDGDLILSGFTLDGALMPKRDAS